MNKRAIRAGAWRLIFFIFITASAQSTPSIVSVQANGKAKVVSAGSVVKLAALENDLHIEWKPCRCTYRYYTEGLDTDTVTLHYPVAHYTNLEGGEYRFWVQAEENGQWSKPAHVSLEIEESITEEGWFWPAVAVYILLLAGAAIYFFLLYNFRQKLKLQSLRNRIAADLHDEVGATLSSIAISTRLIEKKYGRHAPEMLSILQQIKSDSEETIQTIRDTVWTLNPNNDSVEQLFEKMRSLAFQLLTPQDISLTFNNQLSDSETSRLQLSIEQRQNLYLIFKEALNNILKHAEASKVSITLKINGQELLMNIADNGRGFDATRHYEGNGLKNYKKRAAESFMEVTLTSKTGEGTQLNITVICV